MNDIAAIKARREAITLDGWTSGWVDREMESGATCAWAEGPDHIDDDWDSATKLAAKDAAFIAAAPADIDTLLAEVERLTVALHDDAAQKLGDAMLEASRLRTHVAALTAERDALAQQLQQAQDAAKRQAAYISECVDSDGCYRP
jgi:ABC-type transporter Mla subunit MlaD